MRSSEYCHFTFRAMGSPCSLHFYHQSALEAEQLAKQAIAAIEALENKYSRYRSGNLLSTINAVAAQGGAINVDAELKSLLNYADVCYQQSDGLFDITSGVLRKAWDFSHPEEVIIPETDLLNSLLEAVGWQFVSLQGDSLRFLRKGMALDFGGVVKEYAADLVASQLLAQGVSSGLVELGGDIRALGPHPDGSPWIIKVRDPRRAGQHVSDMSLWNEGLATSGDYERFVIINGKRYSHLLSPKTGWPVQGLASVTVKAPQCVVAGSAATVAMLKGDQGEQWLDTLGVEYLAIAPESV